MPKNMKTNNFTAKELETLTHFEAQFNIETIAEPTGNYVHRKKLNIRKFLFLIFAAICFYETAIAQATFPPLGLVAQLMKTKCQAENNLISVLSNTASTEKNKSDAIREYNDLRMYYNMVLSQLIADVKTTNCKRKYRLLNKYYQSHTFASDAKSSREAIKNYTEALKYINDSHQEVVKQNLSPEVIVALIELGAKLTEILVEAQAKKVDATAEILQALMLKSPSELFKPEDKKEAVKAK
jgi:hypothetical protein